MLRNVATTWVAVAIGEVALWWLLSTPFYEALWRLPAALLLVVGVFATVREMRRRNVDRRRQERRGDADARG
jgi:hypothetical protein